MEKHFLGHRERLRQRALASTRGLHDYELIELILFSIIPRRDVKALAKQIMSLCGGSMTKFLDLSIESLETVASPLVSHKMFLASRLFKALYEKLDDTEGYSTVEVLDSATSVLNYINMMRTLKVNHTYVLLMNKKHGLIKEVDAAPLEGDAEFVVNEALLYGASNVVLIERLDIDEDHDHVAGYIRSSRRSYKHDTYADGIEGGGGAGTSEKEVNLKDYKSNENYGLLTGILDKAFYLSYVCGAIDVKLIDCFIVLNNSKISLKYLDII